jgi:UDP-N-acetylmuramate: L-alanyl-gamma-D-glutamyl-meso-diaminopimelate ligase
MGGVAALARAAGHTVTGCDHNVYPPMSSQLKKLGIEIYEGVAAEHDARSQHAVYIGAAMARRECTA